VDSLISALFDAPLLWALLVPAFAVLAKCRLRIVFAVVIVPLVLVLLALISAPTGWGRAKSPDSDDLTNTGALIYLAFYTLVAEAAGVALATATALGSRFLRSRTAREGAA
jgi:hypothetical protein